MRRAHMIFLFILLVGGTAIAPLPAHPGEPEGGTAHAADGRETVSQTDLELVNTAGEKVSLRSFVGRKPLVLVFWATWCPVCREEVPTLNRLGSNPAIQVLAVNLGESPKKVQSFVAAYHVGYPVVRDPAWQSATAYQVLGIPACIILDKGGQIIYRGSTVPENIEAYVRR